MLAAAPGMAKIDHFYLQPLTARPDWPEFLSRVILYGWCRQHRLA